jgi:hypothetical protein
VPPPARSQVPAAAITIRSERAGAPKSTSRMGETLPEEFDGRIVNLLRREKKQIHGMLTVPTEDGETWWCKYHNIAEVTRR